MVAPTCERATRALVAGAWYGYAAAFRSLPLLVLTALCCGDDHCEIFMTTVALCNKAAGFRSLPPLVLTAPLRGADHCKIFMTTLALCNKAAVFRSLPLLVLTAPFGGGDFDFEQFWSSANWEF